MHDAQSLAGVLARFNRAVRERDWVTMRACCHDDAIIDSVSSRKLLTADQAVKAARDAYARGVYDLDEWVSEELPDGRVLSHGMVQFRGPEGGVSDAMFHWLTTGKDGLIWRFEAFSHRADALKRLSGDYSN